MAELRERHFVLADSGDVAGNSTVLTVPPGREWLIESLLLRYTTSAVVGTRVLHCEIRDPSDSLVFDVGIDAGHTASLVFYYVSNASMGFLPSTVLSTIFSVAPRLLLPAGWDLRFLDTADIDAAGDSLRALLTVQEERL